MQKAYVFIMCCSSILASKLPLVDLTTYHQDFILEEKQIIIPEFPGAFNASIVRWQNKFLMCFRVRDSNMISTFEIGVVWLDNHFNPIGTPSILEIRQDPSSYSQNQDPRLIVVHERLYIIYSNFINIDAITTRRMFLAEVQQENETFFITKPQCLHPFEGASKRWEKNWVPFVYENNLLLAHKLSPHHIVRPSLETGACTTESVTYSFIDWKWGELRGGTPALLNDNEYIAFFHSSKYLATTYSQGKKMQHYVMGAYTFHAQPPFAIKRMSSNIIVGKHFYQGPTYNTWKPLRVVFPMSCITDNKEYLWITYGRQDFEIWIAKIDKEKLYESLIPCPQLTGQEFETLCQPYLNQIRQNSLEYAQEYIYAQS